MGRSEAAVKQIWVRVVGAAVVVHGTALSASAQKPARLVEDDSGVLQWVIAAGIIVVISVTAFLNPKRSHLN